MKVVSQEFRYEYEVPQKIVHEAELRTGKYKKFYRTEYEERELVLATLSVYKDRYNRLMEELKRTKADIERVKQHYNGRKEMYSA